MSDLIDGLPKHDDLFWPVVRALRQLDGSADNEQLVGEVSELLGIADELTAIPHKDGPQTELAYRIAWVKSWLKWGGMVDNPSRAVWVLTEHGRGATEDEVNAVRQLRRAEAAQKRKAKVSHDENGQIDDVGEAPSSEELEQFADDDWQNELLDIIRR
jgi:restriction system protein